MNILDWVTVFACALGLYLLERRTIAIESTVVALRTLINEQDARIRMLEREAGIKNWTNDLEQ